MDSVVLKPVNSVYLKVVADPGIVRELAEYFVFDVPGARFSPRVKNKVWDGKIRLLNGLTCQIYAGLHDQIMSVCEQLEYPCQSLYSPKSQIDDEQLDQFITAQRLPFEIRPYQRVGLKAAIERQRCVIISPTGSGKSLMIYLLARYLNKKTLIIVPDTGLLAQVEQQFREYAANTSELPTSTIMYGHEKHNTNQVVISTWQSIYQMDKKWFSQFEAVIADEAHIFDAKSTVAIMTNLINCDYRYGFTGSLDGSKMNEMTLEGLFGPIIILTTLAEMIENKYAATVNIKLITTTYLKEANLPKKMDYPTEMSWLISHTGRNNFVRNLALSLDGNVLLLFKNLAHGKQLFKLIEEANKDNRKVYYIAGEVSGTDRNVIRNLVDKDKNAIIVASYKTTSTGIDIPNLNYVVFASPSKSIVRVLQSLGRGVRITAIKTQMTLIDIVDVLRTSPTKNHALNHGLERIKIYVSKRLPYKTIKVVL